MNRWQWTAGQRRALKRQLQEASDVRLYRRTLAVLEYTQGRSVESIAASLGVRRQSVYNWIGAYMRRLDPSSLADAERPGRPRLWTEQYQALLRCLMESSPERWGFYAVNWTVPLLQEQIQRATGRRLSDETIRRGLRAEQYVWKRPRYVLEPDPQREKKTPDPPYRAGTGSRHRSPGRG
jgi:transposase